MACFDEAAKAFGWAQRSPGAEVDVGRRLADRLWLCCYLLSGTDGTPSAARVRLQRDGRSRVEIAGHEIGTGAYTVIAQTAAERLGVPLEKVAVFIGDSDLPPAPVAGGSNSTASTCSAVMMVCDQIPATPVQGGRCRSQSLTDKAKETVGIGQTPATQAATGRSAARPGEGLRCARCRRRRGIRRVEAGRGAAGFFPRHAQRAGPARGR